MATGKGFLRGLSPQNRTLLLIGVFALIILVAYLIYGYLQNGDSGDYSAFCSTQCSAAQQAGTQPYTFCDVGVPVAGANYSPTCAQLGYTCTVGGYTYNQSNCP